MKMDNNTRDVLIAFIIFSALAVIFNGFSSCVVEREKAYQGSTKSSVE